jgi:diguanylate cyclase (GGDEF)-like protein
MGFSFFAFRLYHIDRRTVRTYAVDKGVFMLELDGSSVLLRFKQGNLPSALLLVSSVTLILGLADFLIGSEISFSIFYLIPVTLAVITYGRSLGIVFSVVCALIWIAADISSGLRYDSWFVPVWNTLVRFGYFVFHASLLARLLSLIREVRDLSLHDPLTKAANWRYFEEYANRLIKISVRQKQKITLSYIDLDNFKKLNDSHGHAAGDEALIAIANIISSQIRPSDLFARLGGDEFALLLADADAKAAADVIARINSRVLEAMREKGWGVTLSIGAIVFSVLPSTIGPMLKAADDLMYEVKKNGKNNYRLIEQIS